jgi:hypothetical protein
MDCLDNIVGLSRTTCDCWDTGKPIDFNTSLSGLYVSDIIPLEYTGGATDCEKGNVWDILATAKSQGLKTLLADLNANFAIRNDDRFAPFSGYIAGEKNNTQQSLQANNTLAGIRLTPHQIKGGKIVIHGVSLNISGYVGPLDVEIYSSNDLINPIDTVSVNVSGSGFDSADFASPVVLDISDRDAQGYTFNDPDLEYYIVYQMPVGGRYANNQIFTGGTCCGRTKGVYGSRQYPFLQYTQVSGIEAPATSDLPSPSMSDTLAKGLRIKADYYCDKLQWLCYLSYDQTAANAPIHAEYARMVSYTTQQIIAKNVCSLILSSNNINSVTIWSTEKIMGMHNHFKKNYMEASLWLAANYPKDMMDCLTCKTTINVSTIKI